ncbi:MAG: hypothetical protein ACM35H_05445 [Bacteroidota bacterium]|nr:hypothetical protein [Kiloniellaceae bacterium]
MWGWSIFSSTLRVAIGALALAPLLLLYRGEIGKLGRTDHLAKMAWYQDHRVLSGILAVAATGFLVWWW